MKVESKLGDLVRGNVEQRQSCDVSKLFGSVVWLDVEHLDLVCTDRQSIASSLRQKLEDLTSGRRITGYEAVIEFVSKSNLAQCSVRWLLGLGAWRGDDLWHAGGDTGSRARDGFRVGVGWLN